MIEKRRRENGKRHSLQYTTHIVYGNRCKNPPTHAFRELSLSPQNASLDQSGRVEPRKCGTSKEESTRSTLSEELHKGGILQNNHRQATFEGARRKR